MPQDFESVLSLILDDAHAIVVMIQQQDVL